MDPNDIVRRYVDGALDGIKRELQSASGGRNNALNVAAFALGQLGAHSLFDEEFARQWCVNEGAALGLTLAECRATFKSGWRDGRNKPRTLPPNIADALRGIAPERRPAPQAPAVPALDAKSYMSTEDALQMQWACVPVGRVEAVAEWLRAKRIDVDRLSQTGHAYALPGGTTAPSWAAFQGEPWVSSGYQLIAPFRDATGRTRNFEARNVAGGEIKTTAPRGFARAGLVFAACQWSRYLLTSGKPHRDWTSRTVMFVEGVKKALQRSTVSGERADSPAVFGIVKGSVTRAIADRIPDGFTVQIATDLDAGGRSHAADVLRHFAERLAEKRIAVVVRDEWEVVDHQGKLEVRDA